MNAVADTTRDEIYNLRFDINYYGADYAVDYLVRLMEEDELIFPDFQRSYVWSVDEASKFIESLLLGVPVPSLFFAKDKVSDKLIVIDGQQRLRTLRYFYEGKFPDAKAFKLQHVADYFVGKTFNDLLPEDKRNLAMTIIHCVIIAENEESNRMFYLFERLNTTGNALKSQEIRNAIYHGKFNNLLRELASSDAWKRLYHKEDNRLEGQELILRFLAFHFDMDDYSGNLSGFLNEFMNRNRDLKYIDSERIRNIFFETLGIASKETDEQAFYRKGKLNKSLFYTIMLFISHNINTVQPDKIRQLIAELKVSKEFKQLNKNATASKKNMLEKLELAETLFAAVQ